jgi:enoyl-CoA hydratase/carnithine racemase
MAQANAAVVSTSPSQRTSPFVTFDTHPDRYAHWKLAFDGPIATLTMDVDEEGGIRPGYTLKLNSYDLGVDIELADALQRIRFEHPEVRSVIVTSAKKPRVLLGRQHLHARHVLACWKVNFCKFTNETRNGIEDSSRHSGLKFVAACNGTTAGGGYELALACDEILLVDDRSAAVSLPEVPLLGVLPGTGGLTRLTDKRRVRRDHADIFCTLVEGVRAQRALQWRLIDGSAKPQQFAQVAMEGPERSRDERASARCSRHPAAAARANRGTTPATTMSTSMSASTGARAARRSPWQRRSRPRPKDWVPFSPRAPRGGRSRWRASWTTRSCSCAPMSSTLELGCSRRKAMPRTCSRLTRRSSGISRIGSFARRSACSGGRSRGST